MRYVISFDIKLILHLDSAVPDPLIENALNFFVARVVGKVGILVDGSYIEVSAVKKRPKTV